MSKTSASSARSHVFEAALLSILVKIGVKLSKLVKSIKGILLMATVAGYSAVYNWKFALILLGSLFVHEYGHVWQLKREGMRVKGMYFIPFVGAVAAFEDPFTKRVAEARVALMGPIWGATLAILAFGVYLVTRHPLAAGVAGWIAFVNLFNLLPILPLDGGRLMRSVMFSIEDRLGVYVVYLGFLLATSLALVFGLGILLWAAVIGGVELYWENEKAELERGARELEAYLRDRGPEWLGIRLDQEVRDFQRLPVEKLIARLNEWEQGVSALDKAGMRGRRHFEVEFVEKVALCMRGKSWELKWFPAFYTRLPRVGEGTLPNLLHVSWDTVGNFLKLAAVEPMTKQERRRSVQTYLFLGLILISLLYAVAHVPDARHALDVFKDAH